MPLSERRKKKNSSDAHSDFLLDFLVLFLSSAPAAGWSCFLLPVPTACEVDLQLGQTLLSANQGLYLWILKSPKSFKTTGEGEINVHHCPITEKTKQNKLVG